MPELLLKLSDILHIQYRYNTDIMSMCMKKCHAKKKNLGQVTPYQT